MTRRRITRALLSVVLGAVAVLAAFALWWGRNPSACPYGLRFFVELPHPFITRGRLREILVPRPGERVLEVGPGAGYYALPMTRWLEPGGSLDVLDVQQKMLYHVMRPADRGRHRAVRIGARMTNPDGDIKILEFSFEPVETKPCGSCLAPTERAVRRQGVEICDSCSALFWATRMASKNFRPRS